MDLVLNYLTLDEWIFLLAQIITVYGVGVWPGVADKLATMLAPGDR